MLSIKDYCEKHLAGYVPDPGYPTAEKYQRYLESFGHGQRAVSRKGKRSSKHGVPVGPLVPQPGLVTTGMLKFTDESAECYLCGPFPGGFAVYTIQDMRDVGWKDFDGKPFRLYLSGNDDFAWSAFFASRQDARDCLDLLEAGEPLDMKRDVFPLGFETT